MNKYKDLNISSNFGIRNNPFTNKKEFHVGIDFIDSEKVYAGFSGVINRVSSGNLEGNYIQIKTKINQVIFYINLFHLEKAMDFIKKGIFVRPDDYIGIMGSTGNSTGPHTHYEIFSYQLDNKFIKTVKYNMKTYISKESKPRIYIDPIQLFDYCIKDNIYI